MSSERTWHSQSEPDASIRRFVKGAALVAWRDQVQTAFEVTLYEDGTVYLACPRIVPEQGKRLVVPDTAVMCQDVDEAKDTIDLVLDRLRSEAGSSGPPSELPSAAHSREPAAPPGESGLKGILSRLDCDPPVDEDALAELLRYVSGTYETELPADYIALLRSANGVDGVLERGAPVVFWKAELLPRVNADFDTEQWMPGLLVIGSDTGDYVYGIDLRADAPADRYVETEDSALAWDAVLWRGPSLLALLAYVDTT